MPFFLILSRKVCVLSILFLSLYYIILSVFAFCPTIYVLQNYKPHHMYNNIKTKLEIPNLALSANLFSITVPFPAPLATPLCPNTAL